MKADGEETKQIPGGEGAGSGLSHWFMSPWP